MDATANEIKGIVIYSFHNVKKRKYYFMWPN